MRYIYIVLSVNQTFAGWLIRTRAKLHFWDKPQGNCYSHASISTDASLTKMMSFARKKINNPFISGLVEENIRAGLFIKKPGKNKIAVIQIPVTDKQYVEICRQLEIYWDMRDKLKYNFFGLFKMLICGKGASSENAFFCTQWITTILSKSGIDFFENKAPFNVRPFDYYIALKHMVVYEGLTAHYKTHKADKVKSR